MTRPTGPAASAALSMMLLVAAAGGVHAQLPAWVPDGARLKVVRADDDRDRKLTGTLVASSESTLSLLRPDSHVVVIPVGELRHVEVSRERYHPSGRTALLLGAILGAAGVALGATAEQDRDANMLVGGLFFFPLGAGLGALIGKGQTSDIWMNVPLTSGDRTGIRIAPEVRAGTNSAAVGGRLTW